MYTSIVHFRYQICWIYLSLIKHHLLTFICYSWSKLDMHEPQRRFPFHNGLSFDQFLLRTRCRWWSLQCSHVLAAFYTLQLRPYTNNLCVSQFLVSLEPTFQASRRFIKRIPLIGTHHSRQYWRTEDDDLLVWSFYIWTVLDYSGFSCQQTLRICRNTVKSNSKLALALVYDEAMPITAN